MAQWLHADNQGTSYEFAGQLSNQPLVLSIPFELPGRTDPPRLSLEPSQLGQLDVAADGESGRFRAALTIPGAPPDADDDELVFTIIDASQTGLQRCHVVLRRTRCTINTALIQRHRSSPPLMAQSRAALLWQAWRRYRELIGLKRFTSGKSGLDVLVFRPRLRDPDTNQQVQELPHEFVPDVMATVWGSFLLVKTGATPKVREEWDRFQTYLRDRLHPFMSRSESLLSVRLGETVDEFECRQQDNKGAQKQKSASPDSQSTIIGSFLGGDLLQAESFEQIVLGTSDIDRCKQVLNKLFFVLGCWYTGSSTRPLREWRKKIQFTNENRLLLSGKFDLSDEQQREQYRTPLAWDVPFIRKEHLHDHLLGKGDGRDGLLYRILDLPVRYSLTHGDLHSRNILADDNDVWLLDFGETGIAPTLFDFAKLELYLRLWCLRMRPSAKNSEDAAFRFESLLLDNLTGSEGSLEPAADLASALGTAPDELLKIAHLICTIRRHAMQYSLGSPDRRDYLAVLFLTVLDSLRFVAANVEDNPDLTENFRLVVTLAWVLEDVLSRMVGLEPYDRGRVAMDPKDLLTTAWLTAPGLPARVTYVINSDSDSAALEPLASTRGVLQNDSHHLDVFDHTLLVLAYVERLLNDAVGGLLDPIRLDQQVRQDLLNQGLRLLDFADKAGPEGQTDVPATQSYLDGIRGLFKETLNDDACLVLKAAALFHDVGKPATRCVNLKSQASNGHAMKQVRFLGHEVYGRQLISGYLKSLLPGPNTTGAGQLRLRIEYLIRRHHDHHHIVDRYADDPKRFEALKLALSTNELPAKEWKYLTQFLDPATANAADFPLLILHGYADTLACRGPATARSPRRTAEIDLLLLALYLKFSELKDDHIVRGEAASLTKGLDQELQLKGPALGKVIQDTKAWYREQRMVRKTDGRTGPTPSEVVAKARELAGRNKTVVQSPDGSNTGGEQSG